MLKHIALRKYLSDKSNDLILIWVFQAFGLATLNVTVSIFLKSQGLSNSLIGVITAATTLISLIISISSTIILEKVNEYKLFIATQAIPLIFLIVLVFIPRLEIFILFLVILSIFFAIGRNSFSIIFKDVTKISKYTKKETLLYSFSNIGWFLGPLIGGLVLNGHGFQKVFALSGAFFLMSLTITILTHLKLKNKKRKEIDYNILKNIKLFFSRKELIKSYFVSFSSQVWYSMIFVYVPLFIIESGLGNIWIGIFLALTQVPLIFVQLKLNSLIQKIGVRNILIGSYTYLGIAVASLFFVENTIIVMIIFFTTGIAMGMIEPLREIYFFKNVKKIEEEKTFPIYMTSADTGNIFGKIMVAGVLLFLPNKFAYVSISIIMLITAYMCLSLKNYKK